MLKKILLSFIVLTNYTILGQSVSATINPNPVEAGSTITLNITYTTGSTAGEDVYAAIELKNSDDSLDSILVEETKSGELIGLAVVTEISTTITLTVPSATIPSNMLSEGKYYEVKIIVAPDGSSFDETQATVIIVEQGTLSLTEVSSLPATVFPNPAKNILHIIPLKNHQRFTSYKIFDVSGKLIVKKSKIEQDNINVSHLASSLYFLQLDNYKPIKFMKQ